MAGKGIDGDLAVVGLDGLRWFSRLGILDGVEMDCNFLWVWGDLGEGRMVLVEYWKMGSGTGIDGGGVMERGDGRD